MCENGCKCAKADLTKEPALTVGESVTVICSSCLGSGEGRYYDPNKPLSSFNDPHCWRCEGRGESTYTVHDLFCPACNVSLLGGQIGLESMDLYGSTHFHRQIAIDRFDAAIAYLCPDCGKYWERGTDNIISEEAVYNAPIDAFPNAPTDRDFFGNTLPSDPRGAGLDRLDITDTTIEDL